MLICMGSDAFSFDIESFHREMLLAARAAFVKINEFHAKDGIYCYAIMTAGTYYWFVPFAGTEASLEIAARSYQRMPQYRHKTIPQLKCELRWSPADSPMIDVAGKCFDRVNELAKQLQPIFNGFDVDNGWEDFRAFSAKIAAVCVDVLKELDREGLFGIGAARELVIIVLLWGDQSDEDRLKYASQLNSESACKRFADEMHAAIEEFNR
jgi:hypothetical protein